MAVTVDKNSYQKSNHNYNIKLKFLLYVAYY